MGMTMETQKIMEDRDKCKREQEKELEFYCNCLLKMIRTYNKVLQSDMLYYIQVIMKRVFPLAVEYFHDRVECFFRANQSWERQEILNDIEESIVEFNEVFHTIINSTNAADKMLFQTAPIKTEIQYVSPKLCAFYTVSLNELANILENEGEKKYGFCVYPTLNSHAAAVILFPTRQENGKVGIIRVPGKDIAKIYYLQVYLAHELFHILPDSKLRLRKTRALKYFQILLYDMAERIFQKSADLVDRGKLDEIFNYFFQPMIRRVMSDLDQREDCDRLFYSSPIMERFAKEILSELWSILQVSVEDLLDSVLSPVSVCDDYTRFNAHTEKTEKLLINIKSAVADIFVNGGVEPACVFYMDIFREVYSDLMTVITMELSPDSYCQIFFDSLVGKEKTEVASSIAVKLRVALVKQTLADQQKGNDKDDFWKSWKEWNITSTDQQLMNFVTVIKEFCEFYFESKEMRSKQSGQEDSHPEKDKIYVNRNILSCYQEYFRECCEQYIAFIAQHKDKIDRFREKFVAHTQKQYMDRADVITMELWENSAVE